MNHDNLRSLITSNFGLDELKSLAYDLSIDYEEFPNTKSAFVREFVIHVERQGRLDELVVALNATRPRIDWANASQSTYLARLLGEEKEPLPFEPEMIDVPAGVFLMGAKPGLPAAAWEQPLHEVELSFFRIARHPVTNVQYAEFIRQTGYQPPKKVGWFGKKPPSGKLNHPVVGVNWFDAVAYCDWLAEQSGRPYRLPTEAQWEKAARGTDGRIYPWGDHWDERLCNPDPERSTAVDAYPDGQSPYGCLDMAGNIAEWVSTAWGSDWLQPDFPYPYRPDDGREMPVTGQVAHRIFRGVTFGNEPASDRLRCTARGWYAPDNYDSRRGFRVVIAG